MKKIMCLALVLVCLIPVLRTNAQDSKQGKRFNMYGIAFYNLENLFDTINNNVKYY